MLMRMAGGALPGMQVDAFIRQVDRVQRRRGSLRPAVTVLLGDLAHPSGGGAPRRRTGAMGPVGRLRPHPLRQLRPAGDEPPPSAEFDAAVAHYRERFVGMVDRTAGGINKLSRQVTSWLRGDQGDAAPDDD